MAEPWPDMGGRCPTDWQAKHWRAAKALHRGDTIRAVAKKEGLSAGTISKWKREWKDRFGPEFLAGDNARGLEAGREVSIMYRSGTQNWSEVRAAAAAQCGITAQMARDVAQQILQGYLDNPLKLAELDVSDAVGLTKVSYMLDRRAGEMRDDGRAGKNGALNDPENYSDQVPAGILDGLDAPIGDDMERIIEMAEDSATVFLHLVDTSQIPADGVIDVDVSPPEGT